MENHWFNNQNGYAGPIINSDPGNVTTVCTRNR